MGKYLDTPTSNDKSDFLCAHPISGIEVLVFAPELHCASDESISLMTLIVRAGGFNEQH